MALNTPLVDELLDTVHRVVVVDALRGRQVLLRLLVLAQVPVRRAAHLERLGRVGVGLERLVAVAHCRVRLLHLEETVGPLGVQQRRRRELQHRGERLDGLGVIAIRGRLRRRGLELGHLLVVGVAELGRLLGPHGRSRVRVDRHQVGVGRLGPVVVVVVVMAVAVLMGVLVLVPMVAMPVVVMPVVVAAAAPARRVLLRRFVMRGLVMAMAVLLLLLLLCGDFRPQLREVCLEEAQLRRVQLLRVGLKLADELLERGEARHIQTITCQNEFRRSAAQRRDAQSTGNATVNST